MKLKLLSAIVFMTLLFTSILPLCVSAEEPITSAPAIAVVLDGTQLTFDVQPQIVAGRTLVPMRKIFEAFGATVEWNEETKTITATKDSTVITMQINNTTLKKGDRNMKLDVPPQIVDDRTLVPVRAIGESFGAQVLWKAGTKTVQITTDPSLSATPYFFYEPSTFPKLIVSSHKDWYISIDASSKTASANEGDYAFQNTTKTNLFRIKMQPISDASFSLHQFVQDRCNERIAANPQEGVTYSAEEMIQKIKVNDLDYEMFNYAIPGENGTTSYDSYYYTVWNNTVFCFNYYGWETTAPQILVNAIQSFQPKSEKTATASFITNYLSNPMSTLAAQSKPAAIETDYKKADYADDFYSFYDTQDLTKLIVSAKKDWYITVDSTYGTQVANNGNNFFMRGNSDILYVETKKIEDTAFDLTAYATKTLTDRTGILENGLTNTTVKPIDTIKINDLEYKMFVNKTEYPGAEAPFYNYTYFTVWDGMIFEFNSTTFDTTVPQTLLDTMQSFNPKAEKSGIDRFLTSYLSATETARKAIFRLNISEKPFIYISGNEMATQSIVPPAANWNISVDNSYVLSEESNGNYTFASKEVGDTIVLMMFENKGFPKQLSEITTYILAGRNAATEQAGAQNSMIKKSTTETIGNRTFQTYTSQTAYTGLTYFTTSYLTELDGVYYEFLYVGKTADLPESFLNTVKSFQP